MINICEVESKALRSSIKAIDCYAGRQLRLCRHTCRLAGSPNILLQFSLCRFVLISLATQIRLSEQSYHLVWL